MQYIKKKYKRGMLKKFIYVCLFFSIFLFFFVFNEVFAIFKPKGEEKIVDIPKNSSVKKISEILKEEKIISNTFILKTYLFFKDYKKLKSGSFKLKKNMPYFEVFKTLINQKNVINQDKITFYEGMNFFTLKENLKNNENFNINEIIDELNKEQNYKEFSFVNLLDEKKLKKAFFPMEGFIFPYTYDFEKNSSSKSIALKILKKTDEELNKISEKLKNSKMDLWDVFTLASIIQSETSDEKEMPRVASVFLNRLNSKKRFESDVTAIYSKKLKDYIKEKNLPLNEKQIKGYDTYATNGLTLGPICIVSNAAINAVINPSKEDYYFFYADNVSGKMIYSKTFKEHKKIYS